jgi:hypothetical protein
MTTLGSWSRNPDEVFSGNRMTKSTNPDTLSRDQRIHELATILARGIIRLLDPNDSHTSPKIKARNSPKEP